MNHRFPAAFAALLLLPFQAAAGGDTVPLFEKGTSTYYVEVDVHGAGRLDFLVDTGSTYSVIDEATLDALERRDLATFVTRVGGTMADGRRRLVPIYSIAALDIGGRCRLRDVQVAVLPGRERAILGVRALKRAAPFVMSVDPPSLRLGNCGGREAAAAAERPAPS